jgi:hypothetical protein
MGCAHAKGKGNLAQAPESRTLLTSRPQKLLDLDAAAKRETLSTQLEETPIRDSWIQESIIGEIDVLVPSTTTTDFVATDINPRLLFPLPPTATKPKENASYFNQAHNNYIVSENAVGGQKETKVPLFGKVRHRGIETTGEGMTVVDKKFETQALHSSLPATPILESSPVPASFKSNISGATTFTFDAGQSSHGGSFKSNNSVGTAFTFGPGQSSYALGSKLQVVTEEEPVEVDQTRDNASWCKRCDATIPEAPGIAVALEQALHSVVDAGEDLWKMAHSSCKTADSVLDENGDSYTSLRTNKSQRGGACC